MKYFIDTEFIEGFHKPMFGKRRHFIDLISIGIVCEDGRWYYAISNEFDLKRVWKNEDQWIKKNVLQGIFNMYCYRADFPFNLSNMRWVVDTMGKSNKQIAEEVKSFCRNEQVNLIFHGEELSPESKRIIRQGYTTPEFYAYYADYDWVLFCSLFGRMIDLPKGFPMYCRDLKQMLDEKASAKDWYYGRDIWSNTRKPGDKKLQEKDYPASLEDKIKKIKRHQDYPKQTNEHNALADAKWNMELYEFLKGL